MKSFLFCTCNKRNEKKTSFLKMQLKKKTPSFLKMLFHFFSISIFSFFLLLFFLSATLEKTCFLKMLVTLFPFLIHMFFFSFWSHKNKQEKKEWDWKRVDKHFRMGFLFLFLSRLERKKEESARLHLLYASPKPTSGTVQ